MELVILGVFSATLLLCIALDVSIFLPLLLGYGAFFAYGLSKKHTPRQLLGMSWSGIKTVKNILTTFLLIGMITAVWRDAGTIPFIIYHFSKIISPSVFLLTSFLLCCIISTLTGTSFGTVATVGVICMTLGNTMQMSPLLVGGAILSGIYFGDRCSPMSTSALLVSELTGTDIYHNIKNMTRTCLVPFGISCVLYTVLGLRNSSAEIPMDIIGLYQSNFNLHWAAVLPAALLMALCLLRVRLKLAMAASIVAGSVVSMALQGTGIAELLRVLVGGFQAADPQLGALMDGGGVLSNVRVIAILCISSTYAGLFEGTGMLDGIKERVLWLSGRLSPFGGLLVTSIVTNMVACNQTLSTMITHYLFQDIIPDNEQLAVDMENTVIVIAGLVPWCIACAVPLATIGAPSACIFLAFYLYLLPLWNLVARRKGPIPKAPVAGAQPR